ncbi:DUF6542 domain-containing protein [Streptomyces specialis]|uniref:DUF6542 domain-containing protein n=1 Tax=Streptomyces specialis TaxID=498367 RepID=UPI00073EBE8C|nr:DUF6542 domain-containing protein [Streptomyces specialis]
MPRPSSGGAAGRGHPRRRPAAGPGARGGPPRPRLTGLGCGVLTTAGMVAAAWFCDLLGGAPALYGTLSVLTSAAAALWVRRADLICAPIAAPIAFATGLVTTDGPVSTVTELALRAPWLFAGTLTAAAIVLLRRGRALLRDRLRRRRADRRARPGTTG